MRASAHTDLKPEKVAYWYFRLNGFLQWESFVVHPKGRGSQRTDADLVGVRFPFREERLIDDPNDTMVDDDDVLELSDQLIDVIIAEVKTSQPCTLNGPWTRPDKRNVQRVLAAIGCLERDQIGPAAEEIYRIGLHRSNFLRVRLMAVGRDQNPELAVKFPEVKQVIWDDALAFIWDRFDRYQKQKSQVDQWDKVGLELKSLAKNSATRNEFIQRVRALMNVRCD